MQFLHKGGRGGGQCKLYTSMRVYGFICDTVYIINGFIKKGSPGKTSVYIPFDAEKIVTWLNILVFM